MAVATRLLIAGLAAALLQLALAAASLAAMGAAPFTWWLGLSGVLSAGVSAWLHRLLRAPGDGGGDGDGPPRGGPSGGEPPSDEPPWWPEFERAFREHAGRPRTGA